MSDLYLLVKIGRRRAAIAGALVQSVVEIDDVVPVPLAPPHVAGLAALRSRALTVIDTRAAIGLEPAEFETEGRAAVVEVDGHGYALLVDEVEDVAEAKGSLARLDATMGPEWDCISLGQIETSVGPAVLVDVAELVAVCDRRQTMAA